MTYQHVCLNCEAADMERTTKDITVSQGQFSEMVAAVYGWHCPNCGEIEFLDEDGSDRVSQALDRVWEQYRAAEAAFIRTTRKKLHLTQKEAAEIFGGGINAFSEYELRKTQPPRSTVKLLQLLDKHPELLDELR